MSAPPKPIKVEDEDLEDLDDVLDQFAAPPPPPPSAAPQSLSATPKPAGTGAQGNRPRTNTRVDAPPKSIPGSGLHGTSGSAPLGATSEEGEDEVDLNEEELSRAFSEELTKGMEGLMKELGSEGKDGDLEDDDAEVAKKFREAWEKMLTEGMNGMGGDLGGLEQLLEQGGAESSSTTGSAKAAGAGKDDFQSKIRQTMGKLKESESNLQNQAPGASTGDGLDSFEALLKSLANLGEDGKLPESDEDLASMLEGMMGQLLHKDILYDPLKELNDAFPPYLAKPPQPLSEEDRQRYNKQIELIQQILKVFENPKYSDEDKEMSKEISDLMNELQNYGSPPTEIMGELPPGMQLGPDGLPSADNCTIA